MIQTPVRLSVPGVLTSNHPRIMTPDQKERFKGDVLNLRMKGVTPSEVAGKLNVPLAMVLGAIASLTEDARQENAGIAAELFMLSNLRTEQLWAHVQKWLDAAQSFDDRLVKCAIAVLERQAKLNGIDRAGGKTVTDSDWIDQASPAEVVAYAKRLGITFPDHILVPGV